VDMAEVEVDSSGSLLKDDPALDMDSGNLF